MKKELIVLLTVGIIILSGCNTKKRSEEIKNYTYEEKSAVLNDRIKSQMGDWLVEGTVCYGLVVLVDLQGKVLQGAPVKSKVISFSADSIKMKSLETVNVAPVKGCKKMGITKGQIWWESQGELFKTKAEAEAFLKDKGWLEK
jgi:hypothetical protein